MKNKITILLLVFVALAACKGNTYSKQIRQEAKEIDNYISRHNINILKEEPKLGHGERWAEKDYIALEGYDHLYFHLSSPIDTNAAKITAGDNINLRYRKYGLGTYTDTVSTWTTDDAGEPIDLVVGDYANTESCMGWHIAILHMGYSGAEGKIICPSTAGFSDDNSSVTPYGYDIKISKRK